jgi:MFS transporter, DHA3 family, macrolide efflux protein
MFESTICLITLFFLPGVTALKKFFVIWASQAFSQFGSAVVGFALAWYLARETGSATILSMAMLANIIPRVVIGPFVGPLVDRWDRKQIMIYSDLFTALLTLILAVLFYTHMEQVWTIYVILFGRSAGGVFQNLASSAAIPMIVERKDLVRANGLNATLMGSINLIAPLAGAFLMEALEMPWVLSVDIITAVIAVAALVPLAIPHLEQAATVVRGHYFEELKQGFRYIASWRGLFLIIILFAILNFAAAPVNALFPLFVQQYFDGDVLKMGWLVAAFSAGMVAGGLILGAWGGFKRRILATLLGIMIQGAALIAFGFTSSAVFFLAMALRVIAGLSGAVLNANIGAIVQAAAGKDMQGRVFAALGSIGAAMTPLGLLIAGPLADAIGLRVLWWVTGAILVGLTALTFFSRDLMNIENKKPGEITGI